MADYSYNGGARGGARAKAGTFRVDAPRIPINLITWMAQARQIMRETGATAEQVIGFARSRGSLNIEDTAIPGIIETLNNQT